MKRYLILAVIGAGFSGFAQVHVFPGAPVLDDLEAHYLNVEASSDSARYTPLLGDVQAARAMKCATTDSTYAWMTNGRYLLDYDVAVYMDVAFDYNGVDFARDYIHGVSGNNFTLYLSHRPAGLRAISGQSGAVLAEYFDYVPSGERTLEHLFLGFDSTRLYVGDFTWAVGDAAYQDFPVGFPTHPTATGFGDRFPDATYYRAIFDSSYEDGDREKWIRYGVAPSDAYARYDWHLEADSVVNHAGGQNLAQVIDDTPTGGSGVHTARNTNGANDAIVRASAAVIREKVKVVVVR